MSPTSIYLSVFVATAIFHALWIGSLIGLIGIAFRQRGAALGVDARRLNAAYSVNLVLLIMLAASIPISGVLSWRTVGSRDALAAGFADADLPNEARLPSSLVQTAVLTPKKDGNSTDESFGNRSFKSEIAEGEISFSSQNAQDNPRNYGFVSADFSFAKLVQALMGERLWRQLVCIAPWVAVAYLIGAAFMLGRVVVMLIGSQRIMQRAIPLQDLRILTLLSELSGLLGLAVVPALATTDRILTPVVVGIWRPMILMPLSLVTGLTVHELEIILIHELSHIRRYDQWVVMLQRVVEAILFFHPTTWYLSHRLNHERELQCDDAVLAFGSSPLAYAGSLCRVAEIAESLKRSKHGIGLVDPIAVAATGNSKGELVYRVRRMLGEAGYSLSTPALSISKTTGAVILAISLMFPSFLLWSSVTHSLDSSTVRFQEPNVPPTSEQLVFVRVIDHVGNPVVGASIKVSYQIMDEDIEQSFDTDEGGAALAGYPKDARWMTVGIHKSGYIPKFYYWRTPANREVPSEIVCKLARGARIGGKVQNTRGEPISGARVELWISSDLTNFHADLESSSTDYHFVQGKDAPVTDADGRWSYDRVPADGRVRVSASHPDYASDSPHGFTDKMQPLAQTELQEQTVVSVLRDGVRIEGEVLSDRGAPISKPHIGLQKSPNLSLHVEGDERGRFRLPVVKDGKYSLSIIAAGFAPEHINFDTSAHKLPLSVKLKPGTTARFRVVDSEDQPLKAWVRVKKCLGVDDFYTIKSAIPRRTDDNGEFEWTWSPAGELTFTVGAPGFVMADLEMSTTEKGAVPVVQLQREGVLRGRVIDRRTRKPIDRFLVIPFVYMGNPMRQVGVVGRNGSFELPISNFGDGTFYLMIEHPGHKSVLLDESFRKSNSSKKVEIEMDAADPITGRVIDANGKAVEGAFVSISESTSGMIKLRSMRLGQTVSDNAGEFSAPAPPGDFSILVIGQTGFDIKKFGSAHSELGDMQLRKWGTVSGQVLDSSGQGFAKCGVRIMPQDDTLRRLSRYTNVDADGLFTFDNVASEASELWVYSSPDADGNSERLATKKIDVPEGKQIAVTVELD